MSILTQENSAPVGWLLVFTVNGLNYTFIDGRTVQLTGVSDVFYGLVGDVFIPGCVITGGISYTVDSIGCFAFSNHHNLTSVILPTSLRSIERYAFWGCQKLTSVALSANLNAIDSTAFVDCSNLTTFNVSPDNPSFCTVDEVLFSKDKTTLVTYPNGKLRGSYTVPNGVTAIGDDAFHHCLNLVSLTLPATLKTVGLDAFGRCKNLKEIFCEFDEEPFIHKSAFFGGPHCRTIRTKNHYVDMIPFGANRRVVRVAN